jgi:predicted transcriptional regulator
MIVRDIVLAIKPKYAQKIYSGEKTFEIRRKIPKSMINRVYLYETTPVKKITGYFTLKRVFTGPVDRVWQVVAPKSGLTPDSFYVYCGQRSKVSALEINFVEKFEHPLNPYREMPRFCAPQNFLYLTTALVNKIYAAQTKEALP